VVQQLNQEVQLQLLGRMLLLQSQLWWLPLKRNRPPLQLQAPLLLAPRQVLLDLPHHLHLARLLVVQVLHLFLVVLHRRAQAQVLVVVLPQVLWQFLGIIIYLLEAGVH